MSIEQLASATKIPRASLELLEDDRYEGLPGPVFVKGFLRCAARALGVEVQTVMDLLYERERAALAARKGAKPSLPSPPPLPTKARAAARVGEEPAPGRAAPR
ncbi:MAG: helix-turn-helix domain-containing protein, partial [Nannocystaceae bacterium]|nr:helix-turn-helix domain-containing protein [Nannocystaceae bacterium]